MEKNQKNRKIIKKVGKVVLYIVIILIVLYIINLVRNDIILSNILEKEASILSSNNIYYEIADGQGRISKFYKKDEVEMLDTKNANNRLIVWRNLNTNEAIMLFPEQKIAINENADAIIGFNVPLLVYSADEISIYKKCTMLSSIIYTDKLNDKSCYIIMNDFNNKTWVDKDTGVVLKRQSGTIENENGEKKLGITYYTNWKVNELKESDIEKPDISGYEVRENN